jgi:hypothetical protein
MPPTSKLAADARNQWIQKFETPGWSERPCNTQPGRVPLAHGVQSGGILETRRRGSG